MRGVQLSDVVAPKEVPVVWRAQSRMLVNAVESVWPAFDFVPIRSTARATPGGYVVGFEPSGALAEWARNNVCCLAMPDSAVVQEVGDKFTLTQIAFEAGVDVAAARAFHAGDGTGFEALTADLGDVLVLQLGENNLTGQGTRIAATAADYRDVVESWHGRRVKASRFVDGLPLTISACTTTSGVLTSAVSLQLVGIPSLTPFPTAHCGNCLVDDEELGDVTDIIRGAAERVGLALRERGFRGQFGLDCIASNSRCVVLEINPRVQSVSSLAHGREVANGLLPLVLAQVLDVAGVALDIRDVGFHRSRKTSQLVVYALRPCVASTLTDGVYEFVEGSLQRVGMPGPIELMTADQATIWSFTTSGTRLEHGDRIAVVQFARRIAQIDQSHHLDLSVQPWVEAVRTHGVCE